MRFIGVDLHTTQITVCYLKTVHEYRFEIYQLSEIKKFLDELRETDEIAVEATGNTRWFCEQVKKKIGRVVIVNPREFEVTKKSVKKTDKRDALNLAKFLAVDMLPEVRSKSEEAETVQRLNETRTKLVRLKTCLMNKIHALAVSRGRKLKRESLSSKKGLQKIFAQEWTEIEKLELEIIVEQIEALNKSIKRLDAALEEASRKLKGFDNLITMTGIGARSAGVLLAVIGDVNDFSDEKKLVSYFGIVPKVKNSNEKVQTGKITKRGSKTGRTTLVQCTLVAIRYNEYLRTYYERMKARRGHGKAKIATARKYLGIIYNTLKNEWVFEDFNNFVLAE
ncbi:MAG: IS110 family transposase [Acidobacteriota bacterium]|nr:IS110 family transposase [Acidobacteriota bacterium]